LSRRDDRRPGYRLPLWAGPRSALVGSHRICFLGLGSHRPAGLYARVQQVPRRTRRFRPRPPSRLLHLAFRMVRREFLLAGKKAMTILTTFLRVPLCPLWFTYAG